MAPMVAASDYAFRRLVERYGVDMTYTQMLHVRHLVNNPTFRTNHLDFLSNDNDDNNNNDFIRTKSQLDCIDGIPPSSSLSTRTASSSTQQQRRPLIVQLAGHDVNDMLHAFDTLVEKEHCQFAGVDINLGCPQGIARKGRYGAFLHEDNPRLVCAILRRLRTHIPRDYTVSCKIRLPRSLEDTDIQTTVRQLVDTGIDFMTVHGRTLEENKTRTRAVHVDKMAVAVQAATAAAADKHNSLPIICNGGIETRNDIDYMLERTNAAAIMSSEALLETPNLFSSNNKQCLLSSSSSTTTTTCLLSPYDLFRQQVGLAREYVDLCTVYPPLPGVLGKHGSFSIVKGHLFKMLHRFLRYNVDLRDQLTGSTKLVHALTVLDALEERYATPYDCEICPSRKRNASWYRRHWHANNSGRVHQRRQQQTGTYSGMDYAATSKTTTIEQQKKEMKQRIVKLRQERLSKNEKAQATLP